MNRARDSFLERAFAYDDSAGSLKHSRSKLPSVLHLADEGILVVDDSLCITVANRGAEKMFGYHPGELLGQPLEILLPPRFSRDHHQHILSFIETADLDSFRTMADHSEVFGLRKDGSEFPLEASISVSERDGRRTFAAILRDITAYKAAGDQHPEPVADSTLLAEMIDDITHDLKTPISVIHANVYLIQYAAEPEDFQRRLDAITAATEQMQHLANVLTSVSGLTDDRQPDFERLDANSLLRDIAAHFAARADECGIQLDVDLESDVPYVTGSDNELLRALGNLMRNALRHTPTGGVIRLVSRCERGGVTMIVEDTGEGIHPDALPHVFERYFRSEQARKTHHEGSGLGLSIVKKIVDMHGGHISVRSLLDQGSCFGIWLPSAPD